MKKVLFSGIILCLPLKQLTVTSSYGYRLHPVTRQYAFHSGIDLRAMHDTIYAVMGGVVKAVRFQAHIGVFVRLDHGGFESEYGHLSQVFSIPGDTVAAGSPLGISGYAKCIVM
jgi:murein DD-endopeptidase MepM/ murein hydrolase activator NlpD